MCGLYETLRIYTAEHILSGTLPWLSTPGSFSCIHSPDILSHFAQVTSWMLTSEANPSLHIYDLLMPSFLGPQ